MINPAEKLKTKQQEFISIRELIQRISQRYPTMSQAQIANWLLIELTDARPVSPPLLIQGALGVIRSPSFDDPKLCYFDLLSAAMANPKMDGAPYDGWIPERYKPSEFNHRPDEEDDHELPF
ncbi:hypothetical protein [Yersinia aleksiciae]|uniref:hypothetical protein n=1 Tax=Yersinia aleksiciae TaxID=263819 RepID=UPI00119CE343|nr:hypothetical protein [Yersinia aleksiciae]